jgi:hypothetical protein
MSSAVKLVVDGDRIELVDYTGEATLVDLADAVEGIRTTPGLITTGCRGCGGCCAEPIPVLGLDIAAGADNYGLALPSPPDPSERREAVKQLVSEHGISSEEAALIYDHNNAEPVTLRRSCGCCDNLEGGLCRIYEQRPFICRLYVCNMADRLESVYEGIVAMGTWHAYHVLGWIDREEIAGNPFLSVGRFDRVLLGGFEGTMDRALESLFFYF